MIALWMTCLSPPSQLHVCFDFFEKIILHPCCICLFFFVLSDIDICYVTQASIEPVVLDKHQIEVVGDSTLPPTKYMYVSLSLKTSFFVHVVYMSKIVFIIWIWHMLFYAGFYWGTYALRPPDWWPTYLGPVGTFMHLFLLTVILMIQHVLFYFLKLYNCIFILLYVGTWVWWICPKPSLFASTSRSPFLSLLVNRSTGYTPLLTRQQVSLCIAFIVRLCMDFPDLVLSLCTFL